MCVCVGSKPLVFDGKFRSNQLIIDDKACEDGSSTTLRRICVIIWWKLIHQLIQCLFFAPGDNHWMTMSQLESFYSVRLHRITVILSRYVTLPPNHQFSWLVAKPTVECCLETVQAGNPLQGFVPWSVSWTFPTSTVHWCLPSFVSPTPPLTAMKAPPHILLIVCGSQAIWTIWVDTWGRN